MQKRLRVIGGQLKNLAPNLRRLIQAAFVHVLKCVSDERVNTPVSYGVGRTSRHTRTHHPNGFEDPKRQELDRQMPIGER